LQFQEIVPDMDDSEFMFNEKQSIRDSLTLNVPGFASIMAKAHNANMR